MCDDNICEPIIRICSDNEEPMNLYIKMVLPLALLILLVSFCSSICLQFFGNYSHIYQCTKCFGSRAIFHESLLLDMFISEKIYTEKEIFHIIRQIKEKFTDLLHVRLYNFVLMEYVLKNKYHIAFLELVLNNPRYPHDFTNQINWMTDIEERNKMLQKYALLKSLNLIMKSDQPKPQKFWMEESPLHHAIRENKIKLLSFYILMGGQLNANNQGDLYSVFRYLIDYLLKSEKVKINDLLKWQIVDHLNSCYFHFFMFALDKELLLLRPFLDKIQSSIDGKGLLHYAVANNKYDQAKFLIENNANVNSTDFLMRTPLHVKHLDLQCAQLLIDNSANVNARDIEGKTPLHFVQYPDVTQLLIDTNANVNCQDKHLKTPLHYAVENVASVNFQHPFKMVEIATVEMSVETVNLLISNKADTNAVDIYGRTSFASQEKSQDHICLLFVNMEPKPTENPMLFNLLKYHKTANLKIC